MWVDYILKARSVGTSSNTCCLALLHQHPVQLTSFRADQLRKSLGIRGSLGGVSPKRDSGHRDLLTLTEWDILKGFSMRGMMLPRKFSTKKTFVFIDRINEACLFNHSFEAVSFLRCGCDFAREELVGGLSQESDVIVLCSVNNYCFSQEQEIKPRSWSLWDDSVATGHGSHRVGCPIISIIAATKEFVAANSKSVMSSLDCVTDRLRLCH
mmetsp:Transcript_16809/g.23027  ORF Transcript_16809/g.23027 Transcript_16809/m.23027 type:complete len:211 (-) Transcript_16809:534-1166(-)